MFTIKHFMEQLEQISKEIDRIIVHMVDGNQVRNDHVEFTLGGHGYVYDYIPKEEIWVEQGINGSDLTATLCHEMIERILQKREQYSYEHAHAVANRIEQVIREELQKEYNNAREGKI